MSVRFRRGVQVFLAAFAIVAAMGLGYSASSAAKRSPAPLPTAMHVLSALPITPQAIPTLEVVIPLFDPSLDLRAGAIDVALELQIPSLDVSAPVQGVGLTSENVMDSPKGPIGDAVWHTAFWYRGGSVPGEVGTATFAGHVNDPLGVPEIFAHIEDLQPGDLIIVRNTAAGTSIQFAVDEVKMYSLLEVSQPDVLAQIYGSGPVAGQGPQPALDGLSHLTLITCAGFIVDGAFDHYTIVYATRLSTTEN